MECCAQCEEIQQALREAQDVGRQSNRSYLRFDAMLDYLQYLEAEGVVELYMADCPPEKVGETLSSEHHYTCCVLYRSLRCKHYYMVGGCIRGSALYKFYPELEPRTQNIFWGKHGSFFTGRRAQPSWWNGRCKT